MSTNGLIHNDFWSRTPRGDVALENINKILCGDSTQMMKMIPDESVSLVVTSPPYWDLVDYDVAGQIGMGDSYELYLLRLQSVWEQCARVLIPNGKLAVVSPVIPIPKHRTKSTGRHTRQILNIASDIERSIAASPTTHNISPYSLFVWQKQTSVKMFGSYPYPPNLYEDNTIEFINVYVKSGKPPVMLNKKAKEKSKISQKEWVNLTQQVWCLYPENVHRTQHPAPFPVAIPLRLIKMYTYAGMSEYGFVGDTVVDPFMGSGSTIVAAHALSRNYIGIDINQQYCSVAQSRLENENCDADEIFLSVPKVKSASREII